MYRMHIHSRHYAVTSTVSSTPPHTPQQCERWNSDPSLPGRATKSRQLFQTFRADHTWVWHGINFWTYQDWVRRSIAKYWALEAVPVSFWWHLHLKIHPVPKMKPFIFFVLSPTVLKLSFIHGQLPSTSFCCSKMYCTLYCTPY